jgi:hypothetical protein
MTTTTATTTLGAVAARQSIITNPMRELLDAYGPAAECEATWDVYPFGTYLRDVRMIPAHVCWADDTLCADCGGAA